MGWTRLLFSRRLIGFCITLGFLRDTRTKRSLTKSLSSSTGPLLRLKMSSYLAVSLAVYWRLMRYSHRAKRYDAEMKASPGVCRRLIMSSPLAGLGRACHQEKYTTSPWIDFKVRAPSFRLSVHSISLPFPPPYSSFICLSSSLSFFFIVLLFLYIFLEVY